MDWSKLKLDEGPFFDIDTGKRKWQRIPKTERFRVRIAHMWCRANGESHSGRIKRIINYLLGRYYKHRETDK